MKSQLSRLMHEKSGLSQVSEENSAKALKSGKHPASKNFLFPHRIWSGFFFPLLSPPSLRLFKPAPLRSRLV